MTQWRNDAMTFDFTKKLDFVSCQAAAAAKNKYISQAS